MRCFRNAIISVSFGVLFSGCGHLSTQFKPMSEPQEGVPRARLRVLANALVKAVPERDCIDWRTPGAGTVFGGIVGSSGYRGKSLDMPFKPRASASDYGEMYIAAGKPITLVFLTTPESNYRCSVAGTFVPEKDKDYEARLWLNSSVGQCVIDIGQLGETPLPINVKAASTCRRNQSRRSSSH
jgi:hypothetical protein